VSETFQANLRMQASQWVARCPAWLQQPANALAAIAPGPSDLLAQLAFGPRRVAADIPPGKHGEGLVVVEGKAADDAAAGLEGVQVAVVPCDCRRDS
jgi:hypothetical protein